MGRFVAFGEVMLRLSPPGRELLLQTPRLDTGIAGAEANVAVAVARLGHEAALVTALPANALGDAALANLRGHGVDCSGIRRSAGRMGLYFVATGAGLRASRVIYDRAGSAFSLAPADGWDWDALLAGADRLHLSGITPALGPGGTAAALAAALAARRLGVPVSFDGNYRAQLWEAWDGDPQATLHALIGHADILFGDERDIALVLGCRFEGDAEARADASVRAAFAAFPELRIIASMGRTIDHVDQHRLTVRLTTRDGARVGETLVVSGIVDRVGSGDAFAAGVLHGLRQGLMPAQAAAQGLALAALKHTIPGDQAPFAQADIDALLTGPRDIAR